MRYKRHTHTYENVEISVKVLCDSMRCDAMQVHVVLPHSRLTTGTDATSHFGGWMGCWCGTQNVSHVVICYTTKHVWNRTVTHLLSLFFNRNTHNNLCYLLLQSLQGLFNRSANNISIVNLQRCQSKRTYHYSSTAFMRRY